MRIYQNPIVMIKEIERDLWEMGTHYQSVTVQDKFVGDNPKYQTIELFGYSYLLKGYDKDTLKEMVLYTGNPKILSWVLEEALERLDFTSLNKNPGRSWQQNPEFWAPFLREGLFSYTYAERWQAQLLYVIQELQLRPNSRQAIMTMYSAEKDMMNWGGRDRVPCSLSYQFAIRNNALTLIYSQRSCDFIKFFAADVYFTVTLLQFVADSLEIKPGNFIHFIGSLHAFRGDLENRGIF
jgi:thymidylate synthase